MYGIEQQNETKLTARRARQRTEKNVRTPKEFFANWNFDSIIFATAISHDIRYARVIIIII